MTIELVQDDLDTCPSKHYPFDQFAIVIHQARFNRRSVGDLKGEKKGAEAATCGRKLIPMCANVNGEETGKKHCEQLIAKE
jgi:hypothetical protein